MATTDTSSAPARRRGCLRLPPWAWVLLVIAGILIVLGDSLETPRSGVWERSPGGRLERVEGPRSWIPWVNVVYTSAGTGVDSSVMHMDQERPVEQPMRLSSLTVVDISGTNVTKRAALELVDGCSSIPSIQRVDVRLPGDELDSIRLGDQILILEEIEASRGAAGWAGKASVDYWLSHVPEFGWGEDPTAMQRTWSDGRIEADVFVVGTPLVTRSEVAEAVADGIDLPKRWEAFEEKTSAVPRFPEALVAGSIDLGDSGDALAAMEGGGQLIYSGVRHSSRGEALWRFEGKEFVDRIDSAAAALEGAGWTIVEGIGSRGADRKTHLLAMSKGPQHLRWQYQENRVSRLQNQSYSKSDDETEWTEHVEGPELAPVVWLHYRHGPTQGELEALLQRAEASGVREAFVLNLARSQREALGLENVGSGQTGDAAPR